MKEPYIRRDNVLAGPAASGTAGGLKLAWRARLGFRMVAIASLLLASLACGFLDGSPAAVPGRVAYQNRLPTLTPTAVISSALVAEEPVSGELAPVEPVVGNGAAATEPETQLQPATLPVTAPAAATPSADGAAAPAPATIATSTAVPPSETAPTSAVVDLPPTATAMPSPTATATQIAGADDWLFSGVRLLTGQEDGSLLLLGDMTNNTGSPQELSSVNAIFYDAQGKLVSGAGNPEYTWPVDAIPQGGRVPFALSLAGMDNVANFDLDVEAGPSRENPRQDFEFLDVSQGDEAGAYCVSGRLRNPGPELESFLAISVIIFDGQDRMINFENYHEPAPETIVGDQVLDFKTCADPLSQNVARYELRAWGL